MIFFTFYINFAFFFHFKLNRISKKTNDHVSEAKKQSQNEIKRNQRQFARLHELFQLQHDYFSPVHRTKVTSHFACFETLFFLWWKLKKKEIAKKSFQFKISSVKTNGFLNRGMNMSAKHKSLRSTNSTHFIEELRNNLHNGSLSNHPLNSVSLTSNKIGPKMINALEIDSMQKDWDASGLSCFYLFFK